MKSLHQMTEKGALAVRRLRQEKLKAGQSFMIYSRELPRHQFYLELPNGEIQLAELGNSLDKFHVVRKLNNREATQLRRKFNLA